MSGWNILLTDGLDDVGKTLLQAEAQVDDREGITADELLRVGPEHIEVLPRGRFLIRNICMVFDAYLRSAAVQQRFSRVI